MTSTWRTIIITITLAVIAAGGAGWMGAQYAIRHPRAAPSLHDIVHRDLNLTAEQMRRLDAVELEYAAQRKRLEAAIRAANRELADAIEEGPASPRLEPAIEHLHHAMGELQKATIAHVFAMRAILTPDQARAFDKEVKAALTQEGR